MLAPNLSWSEVIGPWRDEEAAPAVRVKRVQCADPVCRVWHEPIEGLAGYCTADCQRRVLRASRAKPKPAPVVVEPRTTTNTAERIALMREMYAAGSKMAEVAQHFGVTEPTVSRACAGLSRQRNGAVKAAHAAAGEIRRLHAGGASQRDLASRYGVGVWLVREICKGWVSR